MINLWLLTGLLVAHFVADFLLQSDWMALNKSKQTLPLVVHTSIYALCFSWLGTEFALLTYITHTITDFVTSRVNARLWQANQRRWFFVSVGFDQLIHALTLVWSLQWLGLI